MQHTIKDQQKLNKLTQEKKLELVSPKNLKKRWVLIELWQSYYISKCEYPYKWTSEHLILWETKTWLEIMDKIKHYSANWYIVQKNPPDRSSVIIPHFHLYKLK